MAILLAPQALSRRARPGSAAGWFALYLLLVILGGGLLGGWILHEAMTANTGFLHDLAVEHGPDRILRRFQTALAVILAPLLLKKIGWQGASDLGWSSYQTRHERRRDFFRWFFIGVVLMAVLFATSLVVGIRDWREFSLLRWIWTLVPAFLVTGIGVGFLEETMARGVLYRSMARVWTPWVGALLSSGLFAFVHFMKASPESFLEGPWAVMVSSMTAEFQLGPTPLKFVNMLLFGVVLSRLVHYRGDIWAAVGLHAAAVGCIKWFSKQSVFNKEAGYQPWLGGHSSKFDDGWAMCVLLIVVWIVIEVTHPAGARDKIRLND